MLQKIRDKATGIIGIIIIVLISITFALWGVQNYFMGPSETSAAKVNEREITVQDFESRYAQYRQNVAAQGIDASFLDDPVRRRGFLEDMIENELWFQAADRQGLEAPPETIRDRIQAIEAFRVDGEFNPDVYVELLRLQGITSQELERDIRRSVLIQHIPETILSTAFVTEPEATRLARLQNQTRSFDYVALSAEDFVDQVEVTEEEIVAHYEEHRNSYREPEQVVIEYLEVEASDQAGEIAVDDTILRDRYEAEKGRFRVPERRLASHILVEVAEDAEPAAVDAAREEAAALAAQAQSGADFAELAQAHSDDVVSGEEGGDLGWVSRGEMVAPFEEALFALEEGAISDPVRSSFGFHVIKLQEIDPSRGKSFEEAREELAAEYRETEAERQFLDIQDQLEERLNYSDEPDMEIVAEDFGLELKTAGPFSRRGGAGIAAHPEVVNAAFSETVLADGLISDPVVVASNHVVFVKAIDHLPASTKPLEEVRPQVERAVRQQKAREAARERAEALLARLDGEVTLESAAGESEELELKSADAVSRSDPQHNALLLREVFSLPHPEYSASDVHLVSFAENSFAVVQLESVTMPEPSAIAPPQKGALSAQLRRSFGAAEVDAVGQRLRQEADVAINQDQLGLGQ